LNRQTAKAAKAAKAAKKTNLYLYKRQVSARSVPSTRWAELPKHTHKRNVLAG